MITKIIKAILKLVKIIMSLPWIIYSSQFDCDIDETIKKI